MRTKTEIGDIRHFPTCGALPGMRSAIWAGLGIGCGVYVIYSAWATWNYLYVISDAHRLLNIGLMIALAYVERKKVSGTVLHP